MRYTLRKSEIIRSKKKLMELFDEGSSFFLYPFKAFFIKNNSDNAQIEVLFSVSKKHLGRAVDRNMVRRRMKEAYRLNKPQLLENNHAQQSISLAIVYIGKSKLSYQEIENKLKAVFLRLFKTEPYRRR